MLFHENFRVIQRHRPLKKIAGLILGVLGCPRKLANGLQMCYNWSKIGLCTLNFLWKSKGAILQLANPPRTDPNFSKKNCSKTTWLPNHNPVHPVHKSPGNALSKVCWNASSWPSTTKCHGNNVLNDQERHLPGPSGRWVRPDPMERAPVVLKRDI